MSTSVLGGIKMFVPEIRDVVLVGSGVAFGVFCPAIARKIKTAVSSLFSKSESALEARVKALEAKIVTDGEKALKSAEAEVAKAV
jgi:hypothetical protein